MTLLGQGAFFLDDNAVTIRCPGAEPGDSGMVNGIEYEAVDRDLLIQRRDEGADLSKVCTTPVTNMQGIFSRIDYIIFKESGSTDTINGDGSTSNKTDEVRTITNEIDFNPDISSWDVSNVTSMARMFEENYMFNRDISKWDVGNVVNMSGMFDNHANFNNDGIGSYFNQDIGEWDVSNVMNMKNMFEAAVDFNQDIGQWDVSNVTDMSYMFRNASSFNRPIGNWDVSSVTNMTYMFNASSFNRPIGNWDVSNVTDMTYMFWDADSFNQDISSWCVSNIPSEPSGFSTSSPLIPEYKPVWGTCPDVSSADFTLSILVSDTYGNSRELILGTAPDATTGYDEQYDEPAPPPPPAGGFDARIRFEDSDYFTFYQPVTTEQTKWTLLFAPRSGYGPITLEWSPNDIIYTEGELLLRDPSGGDIIHVNMRRQSSVTIEVESVTGLELVHILPVDVPRQFVSGWNMVSLPVEQDHDSFKDLFPDARDNTLYSYSGTYRNEQVLQYGQGYWLNMTEASAVTFTGLGIRDVTVDLIDGWNLIGGASKASVIDDPEGIVIAGTLYGYDGAYFIAEQMDPGWGYWVAAGQQGTVTIKARPEGSSEEILQSPLAFPKNLQRRGFHRITLRSGDHAERILYFGGRLAREYHPMQLLLPPVPPQGSFDARLAGGRWISEDDAVSVVLQQGNEPVSLVIHGEGRYDIQMWSGKVDRGHQTVYSGEQVILAGDLSRLTLSASDISEPELPMEFTLEQNYPNPFNPGTQIRYGIPERSHTQLVVYDITGRHVTTLVNEPRDAGYHTLNFDATRLASGVYIYRIRAGEFSQSRVMVLTK